ncbi:MAG: hypothetical protein LBE78_11635 [Burkholderiaceae bacterium]|jgi:hypothetical protein|nr:hypothetical protein [Burkholderiaceae bacterium]
MANGKTEFSPVCQFFIIIHVSIMKKTLLITSCIAASLFLLQACGGDGDDTNPSDPVPPIANPDDKDPGEPPGGVPREQGSVSAPFVQGDASRYIMVSPSGQSFGVLSSSQQTPGGAMTTVGDYQLAGTYDVQDINGDASFAIGRWAKGSVTRDSGPADMLSGTDGRAYHYLAYQGVSEFPPDINSCSDVIRDGRPSRLCTAIGMPPLRCTGGSFTKPTYTGGGSKPALTGSSVTGVADISPYGGPRFVSGSLTVNANGETVNLSFPDSLSSPDAMAFTGQALTSNGSGTGVQLAAAGDGAYALVITYAAVTPSGARYIGVGRMNCSQESFTLVTLEKRLPGQAPLGE